MLGMGTIRLLLETLGPARARRNAADALAARQAEEAVLEAVLVRLERRDRAVPAVA